MTLQKTSSGRWRSRIWRDGRDVSVCEVLEIPAQTWRTKGEAKDAYDAARKLLRSGQAREVGPTVLEFWEKWTTDPLYARTKDSTNIHNRERTRAFSRKYGSLPIRRVDDQVVAEWLAGGERNGTIPALRAMFNDAASAKAGRLIDRNPFAKLGIARGRGNRDAQPPSQDVVKKLIAAAWKQAGPSYAAWLKVAAHTGMRPGELDALRWASVDFDRGRIAVVEQFSATSRTFTLPKNGRQREAPLTPPAREALMGLPRESEFAFVTLRNHHWTAAARSYHWKATRAAVGYEGTLYLATRHYAGWYMYNVLDLPSEDVAIALGHEDGGLLVKTLYGHRDRDVALDRVVAAYEQRANVVPLPTRREETA